MGSLRAIAFVCIGLFALGSVGAQVNQEEPPAPTPEQLEAMAQRAEELGSRHPDKPLCPRHG